MFVDCILIDLRLVPDWIRRHLSFRSKDSMNRSACDMLCFINILSGRELHFDSKLAASLALVNLINLLSKRLATNPFAQIPVCALF